MANPKVTRTAYQRLYDMILSHGTEEYTEHKEKITSATSFFDDPFDERRATPSSASTRR